MSSKMSRQNYLQFVPMKNPDVQYTIDKNGIVTLFKEWTGFYNRIAQKFFHKPKVSQLKMDDYGSFVWQNIDGNRDIYQLSLEMEKAFPDMEKALARLIKFMEILRDHRFITWKEDIKE
jgi:hypothetical protein